VSSRRSRIERCARNARGADSMVHRNPEWGRGCNRSGRREPRRKRWARQQMRVIRRLIRSAYFSHTERRLAVDQWIAMTELVMGMAVRNGTRRESERCGQTQHCRDTGHELPHSKKLLAAPHEWNCSADCHGAAMEPRDRRLLNPRLVRPLSASR